MSEKGSVALETGPIPHGRFKRASMATAKSVLRSSGTTPRPSRMRRSGVRAWPQRNASSGCTSGGPHDPRRSGPARPHHSVR